MLHQRRLLLDLFQCFPQLGLLLDLFQRRQAQARLLQSFSHVILYARPQRLWLWELEHESGPIVREQPCSKHDGHRPATQAGHVNVISRDQRNADESPGGAAQ